ncbi:MAG: hypothetical protein J6582_10675, partial [Snodgrassella sp.]
GESIIGVAMAMIIVASIALGEGEAPLALNLHNWDIVSQVLGLIFFVSAIVILVRQIMKK